MVCLGQLGGRISPSRKLERLMGTVLNIHEVQQHLDRAARDARHGPTDIRAGRFMWASPASSTLPATKVTKRWALKNLRRFLIQLKS